MAVTKVGLLLLSTASYTVVITPPNPPASEHARATYESRFNSVDLAAWPTIFLPILIKLILWSITLLEIYLVIFPTDTDSPFAQIAQTILGNYPIDASNLRTVSPSFLCGCGFIVLSSLMRLQCYRAMGRMFTFQLAVLPDHKLITHGPYSVVRHPSYTAVAFLMVGSPLVYCGPGSLLHEVFGVKLYWGAMTCMSLLGMWLGRRARIEDAVLSKEFGDEWKEWARSVRWKMIPGIF